PHHVREAFELAPHEEPLHGAVEDERHAAGSEVPSVELLHLESAPRAERDGLLLGLERARDGEAREPERAHDAAGHEKPLHENARQDRAPRDRAVLGGEGFVPPARADDARLLELDVALELAGRRDGRRDSRGSRIAHGSLPYRAASASRKAGVNGPSTRIE